MKLLRDPLVHFALLGLALFGAYVLATNKLSSDEAGRIEIDASTIQLTADRFEMQWRRPPTEEELRNLVQSRVREEVLYREALKVGLDRDDSVVRRRMVQKMELLSQDLALLADPTDEELRSFFEESGDDYRIPPRLTFTQVYFNADRRGAAVEEQARRALEDVRAQRTSPERAVELGDRSMLPQELDLAGPAEVSRTFGSRFADAVFELGPGWHGPIVSGYGLHLVYVAERVEARQPQFEQVRDRLTNDYNVQRRERANTLLFESLAREYEVEVDEEALKQVSLGAPVDQARDGDRR